MAPAGDSTQRHPKTPRAVSTTLRRILAWSGFPTAFMAVSVGILAVTTVYWSVLSSRVQEGNADQFSDAFLFDGWSSFHGALFPGAHTFLMKWPVFALMGLYGYHTFVFLIVTVLMVLVTVAALACLLYKIERRPLLFGTLCLLLSVVLLLTPAQPYPGALLPVNMAMTTTRNVEYALFVWALYVVVAVKSIRRYWFWVAGACFALLIASDKLFTALLCGGGIVLFAASGLAMHRRREVTLGVRMMLLVLVAAGLANLVLISLGHSGITHILSEEATSPYPLVTSPKQIVVGLIYAAAGLGTVMGANPVHSTVVVQALPKDLVRSLMRPEIVAYAFDGCVLCAGWFAAIKVSISKKVDMVSRLTTALMGATLAAVGVFVLTDHYYPVDARYLYIELFMVFVALAAYIRTWQPRIRWTMAIAVISLVCIPLAMLQAWHEYGLSLAATAGERKVMTTVADIVSRDHISRLIGDYWKVMPVKARTTNAVTVVPTDSCDTAHGSLTSTAWTKLPRSTPTAAFVTRDKPEAETFDGCSLAKIATMYGTPSQRLVLHTYQRPPYTTSQLLLVYPHGVNPLQFSQPAKPAAEEAAVPPTVSALNQSAQCAGTSLNVVAHEDDDLLFMNPDVLHDLTAGRCVRTVYVTAGDAGENPAYWRNRELGSEAAYATMLKQPNQWHEDKELLSGTFVTVASLEKSPAVSLVFLHVPDGNLDGGGFMGTRHESLHLLLSGILSSIHTVDDHTPLTKEQLVGMVHTLIETDAPDVIRSQGSDDISDGDHSDHHAVGLLSRLAVEHAPGAPDVRLYIGYPDKLRPTNLSDADILAKREAFLAYAKFDGAVCQTPFDCAQSYTYGQYLTRQYPMDQPPPLTDTPTQAASHTLDTTTQ